MDAAVAEQARKRRTGRLVFYHPNGKGTGSAAQFELRLNRDGEDRYDCFFLEMARQRAAASENAGQRTPAAFDWANKGTVKLDFMDVSQFLMVLEGRCEEIGNGRGGIYHESGESNTLISFRRSPEPKGYFLGVSRKKKDGTQLFKGQILLSDAEATGLRCVFQAALFFLAFGAESLRGNARPPSAAGET
ncbi:MAG: hypothetical protein V1873_05075 [Verrucomicrobiota bacterium]